MSRKVLVVEDESINRRVVMYALKNLPVEVHGAEDGTEALALAEEHTFQLAFVDLNLPDMDGFEVMRRLKAVPHLQALTMIVFTARNDPGDKRAALEAGAIDFLYKPFSTLDLRDLVMRHTRDD